MTTPIATVRRRAQARFAPPPRLTVSEFADKELVVVSGPHAGARWRTNLAPYQRGIMDAFHEPNIEIVAVMGSSQWGKTSCAVNIVAYHIAHDPCSILVVEPTERPMAEDFSKNRLAPLIEACPSLRDRIVQPRAVKDSDNTIFSKRFPGGAIALAGANSPSSLAARPVRLLVLDEVDRYPPELGGEGSTIEIARKRTQTYGRRRRIFMASSPTIVGAHIDTWFHDGDQRHYYVPCPHCEYMHVLTWANLKFEKEDPDAAHFVCPRCSGAFGDRERIEILAAGQWRAEKPTRSIASFHLWEGYSPFSTLAEIVRGFLHAKQQADRGDHAAMHSWVNTTLGEPREVDDGVGAEPNTLLLRREPYVVPVPGAEPRDVDVPAGACCLTLGIDVQDDRFEVVTWGWGPGEESWVITRDVLPGDTSQPGPWAMLDELLDRQYEHASGVRLHALAACIDSGGHRTTLVYNWAFKHAARRVFATIGRDGERPIVSSPSPRRWGRDERQVPLYTVGVDAAKALIVGRLRVTAPGAGFVHLPLGEALIDEEFVLQLTSEKLETKFHKGVVSTRWVKTRPRNEALDCAVLALAALRLLNPNLTTLAGRFAQAVAARGTDDPATSAARASAPAPSPRSRELGRSSYIYGG